MTNHWPIRGAPVQCLKSCNRFLQNIEISPLCKIKLLSLAFVEFSGFHLVLHQRSARVQGASHLPEPQVNTLPLSVPPLSTALRYFTMSLHARHPFRLLSFIFSLRVTLSFIPSKNTLTLQKTVISTNFFNKCI